MQKAELLARTNMGILTRAAIIIFPDLNHVPSAFVTMAIRSGAKHLFANFSRYVVPTI